MSELVKICAICGRELPIKDFHKQSMDNCKNCMAQKKLENHSIDKSVRGRKKIGSNNKQRITDLDRIAKICKERGITYGQWQVEQTTKKIEREEQLNGRKTLTGRYRKHN